MIPDVKDDVAYFRLLVLMCIFKGYASGTIVDQAKYFYNETKNKQPNAP